MSDVNGNIRHSILAVAMCCAVSPAIGTPQPAASQAPTQHAAVVVQIDGILAPSQRETVRDIARPEGRQLLTDLLSGKNGASASILTQEQRAAITQALQAHQPVPPLNLSDDQRQALAAQARDYVRAEAPAFLKAARQINDLLSPAQRTAILSVRDRQAVAQGRPAPAGHSAIAPGVYLVFVYGFGD